jgi:hypothetical protein
MKQFILPSLFLLGAFLGTSCEKVSKFTQFRLSYDTETTIPATPVPVQTVVALNNLLSQPTNTNAEQSFSGNNTGANYIEKISLETLTISIKTPAGGNLNFLRDMSIFISTADLPEVKIAEKLNIADGLNSLDLDATGTDIKDYIKAEKFTLRTSVSVDGTTSEETKLNIHTKFLVDAKILGE